MTSLKEDQRGIAAIIVTTILILVISLVVYGIVEVSSTNQNEALTSQEGSQAFDAAETGVNVADQQMRDYINANPGQSPAPANTCSNPYQAAVGNLGSPNVHVTCLLVNPSPTSLIDNPLGVNDNVVWELNPGASTIGQLLLSWGGDPSQPTSCLTEVFDTFPSQATYNCDVPTLQVDIFQDWAGPSPASALSNPPDSLNSYTLTLFIQPTRFSPNTSESTLPEYFNQYTYAGATSTNPLFMQCQTTLQNGHDVCNADITIGNPPNPNPTIYYVRIVPMYEPASGMTLTPETQSGVPIGLQDAQAVIDSTAKDNNVVRRIQVHVPLPTTSSGSSSAKWLPNNAIESVNNICKQLFVGPTYPYTDTCPGDDN